MTWLVIAPVQDLTARWAADRLTRLGVSPLEVITDAELARAAWNHQLGDDGVVTQLTLPDGRVIDSSHAQGTLNRLPGISWSLVAGLSEDDRMYAFQEINALLLSFLNSLPGPMLNPPDPRVCAAHGGDLPSGACWHPKPALILSWSDLTFIRLLSNRSRSGIETTHLVRRM